MMIRRSKHEKSDLESLSSDANGSETKGEEAASRRRRGLCCCSAVTVLVCFFLWRWSLDGSLTTSHMSFRQKAGDTYWLVRSAHSRWKASSAVSVFPSSKHEAVVDFRASLEECAPVETALAIREDNTHGTLPLCGFGTLSAETGLLRIGEGTFQKALVALRIPPLGTPFEVGDLLEGSEQRGAIFRGLRLREDEDKYATSNAGRLSLLGQRAISVLLRPRLLAASHHRKPRRAPRPPESQ